MIKSKGFKVMYENGEIDPYYPIKYEVCVGRERRPAEHLSTENVIKLIEAKENEVEKLKTHTKSEMQAVKNRIASLSTEIVVLSGVLSERD